MKLTVLGCGDAFGSEGRFNTSFLIEDGSRKILLDCGASTLLRLKQLKIAVDEIDTIILSHFHGDHYGGLPFLMLSNHIEYQRTSDLTIIGPEGVHEKVYHLQEAVYPGTTNVLDSLNLHFMEFNDEVWLRHDDFEIYTRRVTHAPPSNPHGVKLRWAEKCFAFSGDTEWNDSLVDLAEGADLFVVECNNFMNESPGHLSYKTLLEKRLLFKAEKIMLTHMGSEVLQQKSLDFERLEDGQIVNF